MSSKIFVLIVAVMAYTVEGGEEAPPPKAHSYSVPSVAKVSYPAPTLTKSVETYSAPSIEKTTTITRTITAPLNAPALKSVQYSAPAAPVHRHQGPVIFAAPGFAGQESLLAGLGYGGYSHNIGYAQNGLTFAAPNVGYAPRGYVSQGYAAVQQPNIGYAVQPNYVAAAPVQPNYVAAAPVQPNYLAAAPGLNLATTYAAPQLGYSLQGNTLAAGHGGHVHYAPAPVVSKGVAYGH